MRAWKSEMRMPQDEAICVSSAISKRKESRAEEMWLGGGEAGVVALAHGGALEGELELVRDTAANRLVRILFGCQDERAEIVARC